MRKIKRNLLILCLILFTAIAAVNTPIKAAAAKNKTIIYSTEDKGIKSISKKGSTLTFKCRVYDSNNPTFDIYNASATRIISHSYKKTLKLKTVKNVKYVRYSVSGTGSPLYDKSTEEKLSYTIIKNDLKDWSDDWDASYGIMIFVKNNKIYKVAEIYS